MGTLRSTFISACLLLAGSSWAGPVVVDFLDVGQGDSILIRGGGMSVLIDAGPDKADVAGQLRTLGVRSLDWAIATHPHTDHIGGLEDVLLHIDVEHMMDNGMPHATVTYRDLIKVANQQHVPYQRALRGQVIALGDEATLTVLFPEQDHLGQTRSDLNSNSVVIYLEHGESTFLFTGDAEAPTEYALLDLGLQQVDVLKVPHHGSDHSSTIEFLAATQPTWAVISAGTDNKYGHPDPPTLKRLTELGAKVFRTDTMGHIMAISDGRSIVWHTGTVQQVSRRAPDLRGGAPASVDYDPLSAAAFSPVPPPPETERERKARLKAEQKAQKRAAQ